MEKAKPAEGAKTSPVDNRQYYRLIALWIFAFLLPMAQFGAAYRWLRPNILVGEGRPQIMLILLGALAICEFVLSIWLWRNIQIEAAAKRDLHLSELGYLAAWLLCLAAGPLGFVIALSGDGRYYFGFFILSALGILYHQPAREILAAATPKVEAKKPAAEKPVPEPEPSPAPDEPAATDTISAETGGVNDAATP